MEIETSRIFVKVVQQGSFSKAAQLLKLPVSTVSRAVRRLEDEVGTQLLMRTTRSLKLTASGRAFFETSVGPVQILEDARRSLQGADSIIAGTVRLTTTEDLGQYAVTPALSELISAHPELSFEFSFTDRIVDLVTEGFDLAVRVGQLPSSRLRARKVGDVTMILVASPKYVAEKPRLREPNDLASPAHSVMAFSALSPRLKLICGKRAANVRIHPRAQGNHMGSLVAVAASHGGIAVAPHFVCKNLLEEKKLIRVLPEWSLGSYPVHVVTPGGSDLPARVRMVSTQLIKALSSVLS